MTRDEFLALPTTRKTMEVAETKRAALDASGKLKALNMGARLGQARHLARDPGRAYRELVALADDIDAALRPYAVCSGEGCADCCHIAVTITEFEARQIGMAAGVAPLAPAKGLTPGDREETRDQHFGVPCPFLSERRCSIYRHRPLACRVFASLGDNAGMCSPLVPPHLSLVPQLNLQPYWLTVAWIFQRATYADIRDFFPKGARACE